MKITILICSLLVYNYYANAQNVIRPVAEDKNGLQTQVIQPIAQDPVNYNNLLGDSKQTNTQLVNPALQQLKPAASDQVNVSNLNIKSQTTTGNNSSKREQSPR